MSKMNFIVIDDSKIDCFIAEKVLLNSGLSNSCQVFQRATDALEHIKRPGFKSAPVVIFVDEHMPFMSGTDFVKAFSEAEIPRKEDYQIYLLSSSIGGTDRPASEPPLVKKFINKPLTQSIVQDLFHCELKCISHE